MASVDQKARICSICGNVFVDPFQATKCAERGMPKTFPPFQTDQLLALESGVFADRFPGWGEEDNRFKLIGRLLDMNLDRTEECRVIFDGDRQIHLYQVHIRCIGRPEQDKVDRKIWVRAEAVRIFRPEGESKP
jgi:hypothetical protein